MRRFLRAPAALTDEHQGPLRLGFFRVHEIVALFTKTERRHLISQY